MPSKKVFIRSILTKKKDAITVFKTNTFLPLPYKSALKVRDYRIPKTTLPVNYNPQPKHPKLQKANKSTVHENQIQAKIQPK